MCFVTGAILVGPVRRSWPIAAALVVALLICPRVRADDQEGDYVVLPRDELVDRIRGGLLGEMLGNLNGLPHEMKYLRDPGNVARYTPALPEGAWTDDDTDIEWVYVCAMQQRGRLLLTPTTIAELWKRHINSHIWCANQYARRLMDLGFLPPTTGNPLLNPWSDFNISGQFLCEAFGLVAPGMPQTAARLGIHYTRTGIDGEPAQATQLFTAMIATAFLTDDPDEILRAGLANIDRRSVLAKVVGDVRTWYARFPHDWRATRLRLKEHYSHGGGTSMRDRNGYELNTGSIVAALLYGRGRVDDTLRMAFNFGWDADCNAATAGTIVGVMTGYRRMMASGWVIVDRYRNRTRPGMPEDETIITYADRLVELAERCLAMEGGKICTKGNRPVWIVPRQVPKPVAPLRGPKDWAHDLIVRYPCDQLRKDLRTDDEQTAARAAYVALCTDRWRELRAEAPDAWRRAVRALGRYEVLVKALFSSPTPRARRLKEAALLAGLKPVQ